MKHGLIQWKCWNKFWVRGYQHTAVNHSIYTWEIRTMSTVMCSNPPLERHYLKHSTRPQILGLKIQNTFYSSMDNHDLKFISQKWSLWNLLLFFAIFLSFVPDKINSLLWLQWISENDRKTHLLISSFYITLWINRCRWSWTCTEH